MSEEIKVSASDRSLIKIIDDANYSGYGNAVTAEIERLQTKIAALEAALHNSCEAHGMRVRSLLQIIEERTSALERLEIEVVELRKNKEGLDWLNYFYKHPNPSHTGDCSYYSSTMNGNPFDGICTCGYGWRFYTANNNDDVHLVSRERKEALALNSTKGEK